MPTSVYSLKAFPLTDYFMTVAGDFEGYYSCGHYTALSNKAIVRRNCLYCSVPVASAPNLVVEYEFGLSHTQVQCIGMSSGDEADNNLYLLFYSLAQHFMTLLYFDKATPTASTANVFESLVTDVDRLFKSTHFLDHVTGIGFFAGSAREVGGRTYFTAPIDAGVGFFFLVDEDDQYNCYTLIWDDFTITSVTETLLDYDYYAFSTVSDFTTFVGADTTNSASIPVTSMDPDFPLASYIDYTYLSHVTTITISTTSIPLIDTSENYELLIQR